MSLSSGRSWRWGDARQQPRCPVDVTVADDGRVYVADTTLRAVLVYESTGTFVEILVPPDNPERSSRPAGVLVMDGVLYIADAGRRCVERWALNERRWR